LDVHLTGKKKKDNKLKNLKEKKWSTVYPQEK